jgi:hypothetical protein
MTLSQPTPLRAVWLSGLLALALFTGLAWYLSPLKPGVVALQFAFTPQAFGEIIHQWSPEDLQRYRRHLPVDFILLATYGLFGYLLVRRAPFFRSCAPLLRRLASWLLPVAAIFDALENALHGWLTEVPRFGVPAVYAASASFSALKWALILGFGLLLAYALFRADAPGSSADPGRHE